MDPKYGSHPIDLLYPRDRRQCVSSKSSDLSLSLLETVMLHSHWWFFVSRRWMLPDTSRKVDFCVMCRATTGENQVQTTCYTPTGDFSSSNSDLMPETSRKIMTTWSSPNSNALFTTNSLSRVIDATPSHATWFGMREHFHLMKSQSTRWFPKFWAAKWRAMSLFLCSTLLDLSGDYSIGWVISQNFWTQQYLHKSFLILQRPMRSRACSRAT